MFLKFLILLLQIVMALMILGLFLINILAEQILIVMILSSLGEIVFETDNYDNYNGWPQTLLNLKISILFIII